MTPQSDDSSPEWLRKREIPSSLEIKGEDENATIEEAIELDVNRVHIAWESKEKYLESHYRLLREDAITPLRNAVAEVRQNPYLTEEDSFENAAIYEKVLSLYSFIGMLLIQDRSSSLLSLLRTLASLLEFPSRRGEWARRSYGSSRNASPAEQ